MCDTVYFKAPLALNSLPKRTTQQIVLLVLYLWPWCACLNSKSKYNGVTREDIQSPYKDFKIQRRGRQQGMSKNNRFYKQNNNFARASHLFVHFFARFLMITIKKVPNLTFYGARKQWTTKFYFSVWTWIWSLGIQLQKVSPKFEKGSG